MRAGIRKAAPRGAAMALVVLVAACSGDTTGPRAAAGGSIALSDGERGALNAVVQQTLESRLSGESAAWRASQRSISAVVTPVRTYPAEGTYCREYEEVVSFAGNSTTARRIACRAGDGVWRVHEG